MGEVHYMISEAAKKVSVEPHVLRYWEDELNLPIGRNDMGHRFYTEENIQLFDCIKELKEQGLSLKELKILIPDILRTKEKLKHQKKSAADVKAANTNVIHEAKTKAQPAEVKSAVPEKVSLTSPVVRTSDDGQASAVSISDASSLALSSGEKTRLLKGLLSEVVVDALLANNKILEEAVCSSVNENVVKNMDYLLQAKERQEEDRYRKLDHLIRQQQANRKESAKMTPVRKFKRLIGEA